MPSRSVSGHGSPFCFERLPTSVAKNSIDHVDHALDFVVARVEVRRDANAGVRPIVDDDVVCQQRLGDAVRIRHIERDRTASPRRIARRRHLVAPLVGERDQSRRLANALFARTASIPAWRTMRGPSIAANSAGIGGVPFSHRHASAA